MGKNKGKVNLWETHRSTVLSITLVMFLLGLCMLVEYHSWRVTHDIRERITYKVDLDDDITDEDAQLLKATLEAMPSVKHVDFISRKQAAEIFTEDLDEDFVGFIGYNPLYPSMMVNLKADYIPEVERLYQKGNIDQFAAEARKLEHVTGVTYQENVVSELNDAFYKVTWFLIVFMALLALVSVLMIRSTIGIALFAQRDTIHTMLLVGAKRGFVARPYLLRSLWYGLIGSIMAIIALAVATWVFNQSLSGMNLLDAGHMLWYGCLAAIVVIVGIVLSYLSTLAAVHRYL